MTDCDRECFVIGGPWIGADPEYPVHGTAAQAREAERPEKIRAVVRAMREAFDPTHHDGLDDPRPRLDEALARALEDLLDG